MERCGSWLAGRCVLVLGGRCLMCSAGCCSMDHTTPSISLFPNRCKIGLISLQTSQSICCRLCQVGIRCRGCYRGNVACLAWQHRRFCCLRRQRRIWSNILPYMLNVLNAAGGSRQQTGRCCSTVLRVVHQIMGGEDGIAFVELWQLFMAFVG